MHPDLTRLEEIAHLDEVLAQSVQQPVLLFKHSYSCGVSAEALDELITHLNERRHTVRVAMVTVQTHRHVSNAVTARLGVRHETPQALLVRDGKVIWSASHFRVTSRAMDEAIRNSLPGDES
jgi:bacillithiol system protein YtxJ